MQKGNRRALGFVAGGFRRHTRSEGFRARERAVRAAVQAEFALKLAAGGGWLECLRVHWQLHLAMRRAVRQLYPSKYACF